MKPIYKEDFADLSPEKKLRFVYDLNKNAQASFQGKPHETQLLAQTLIFTRWWNSYQHMAPQEPTPEILGQAIELLWDYLEGKCPREALCRFQKSFDDSCVWMLTGDDSGLNEDPASNVFYQAHFAQWDSHSYDVFFSALDSVLIEAVSKTKDGFWGWEALEEVVYGDIGDTMMDFFDPICPARDGSYPTDSLEHRNLEAYSSPMFIRTITLLQQDMRTALDGTPIPILRERYRDEYLFSPEESTRISARR